MKLRSRYKSDTVISQANQPLTSSSDSTLSFPARKSKKPKGCTTINTAPANRSGVDQTASVSDIPRATEKHQASNRSNSNSPQVSSSCVTNLSFPVLASPQCTVDIDSTHFGVKLRKNRTSTSAVAYSQCSSAICEGASAELPALTVLGSTDTPAVKPRARNSKRAKSVVYRKEIVSHSRQPLTGEERQSHRSGSSNCSNTDSLVQHIEQPSVSGVAGIGAELLVPAKCGESCTASEPSEKRRCLRSCRSKSAEAVLEIPAPSVQEPADEKPKPSVGRKAGVVTSEGLHSTSSRRRSLKGKKTGSCASSSGQYSSASGNLRQVSVPAVFSCLNFSTSSALQLHHTAAKPSTSSSLIYQVPCDSMSGQEMSNTDRATSRGHNSSESTEASGFGTRHREDAGSLISTSRPDQDGDEVEMGRLQALSKVQQLIHGLQATGDEDQQLTAAMEMCQLLVMGTEDNLVGFPVKQAVPPLIALLQLEHNFDIMNHACRALTYMMEALPRSSTVVVDAVPVFLEKLQVIQCMDVAEQALTALETLSKRHSKAILQHNGIAACLTYIDFFSAAAQRSALMVAANCAQSMTHDEFRSMSDCLPVLTGRLSHASAGEVILQKWAKIYFHQDKKSIESVCLCFSRLVDNFHSDQRILKEILVHGLLSNIQQLVMVSPPVISISIFVMVIRMLAIMCSNCPDLAVLLLKQKISDTLCYLLVGPSDQRLTGSIELVSRTPQELYELVSLIGELLPNLPCEGVFAIDAVLRKGPSVNCEAVIWQWQDDRSTWHSYMPIDSKIIEAAYQAGEDEVCLSASGRSYSVDYNSMQQVNEDTGTSRPVQRKVNPLSVGSFSRNAPVSTYSADPDVDRCDARAEILKEDYQLTSNFIQTLFAVLYEVYSCSAGPSVRHKCLQTILRTIYYASPDLLRQMLKTQPVSSHIAAMMASPDLKVVVGAFQMADILMQKLPDIFGVFFRREGVMHQVKHITNTLCASSAPVPATMTASFSSSQRSFALQGHAPDVRASSDLTTESRCQLMAPVPVVMAAMTTSVSSSFQRLSGDNRLMKSAARSQSASSSCLLTSVPVPADEPALSHLRLGDVLKRKRPAKRVAARRAKCEDSCADPVPRGSQPTGRSFASRNKAVGKDLKNSSGTGSKVSSFLPSFNPRSWGRFGSSEHHTQVKQESIPARPIVSNLAMNKEKIRSWIKEQADRFLERYFPSTSGVPHPAHGVLNSLTAACQHLTAEGGGMLQLKTIGIVVKESDVSPFEVIHSGLIQALLQFLTSQAMSTERDLRLRQFLHVFLNCPEHPVTQVTEEFTGVDQPYLFYLIGKLMGCLHQLEQFQVKIHDLPGAGGVNGRGSSALKFLTTHQLKCQLQRHPSCTGLRQWKAGPVKIDPLALVQAIERYLVMRGYGNVKEGDDDVSDDDNSDEEMEDSMAAMFIGSQGNMQHRLEFVIGDRVLPYNMTVYQAIRQFTPPSDRDPTDTDPDPDNPLGHTGIWVQTHTIWYRPAPNQHNVSTTDIMKTKLSSKGSRSSRKKDNTGPHPIKVPMMYSSLSDSLPSFVTVSDASLQTIALLRVLDTLNRHWASLYNVYFLPKPVVPASEFISSKLMAKATRQMQDPLIIMTGNLPPWLIQIGRAAPFLFPFDARQMLFAATVLDRDRAMLRLQQETSGLVDSAGHDTERLGPRLDRRKKTVNRACILKQAEKIMDEMVNSKAMLEVQYEDEVGTGLGPTLEFYALVSREMQRADLELWWGERVQCPHLAGAGSSAVEYMHSPLGLFPSPLARSAKISSVNRTKSKFRFLGKFMAKALLDNRLIDIPLCLPFYKWMLGQERSFGTADLHTIDPQLASFFQELESLLHQRRLIIADQSHTEDSRQVALDSLLLASGGSRVQDLDLTFLVPGTDVELKRGGKDVQVTLQNLQEYVKLAVHWMLVEGVHRQLEAFQQGFEAFMPLSSLQCFYPEELEQVFCGSHWIPWDVKMLMDHCRPDHGYTHDSSAIQHLFQILASYDKEQQRQFLQFVTGSPRLPVGGFRTLNPALTIVRKDRDEPDEVLPSVMTCVNYLKLPDYSSLETMRQKLHIAASEGQLSFHLS